MWRVIAVTKGEAQKPTTSVESVSEERVTAAKQLRAEAEKLRQAAQQLLERARELEETAKRLLAK